MLRGPSSKGGGGLPILEIPEILEILKPPRPAPRFLEFLNFLELTGPRLPWRKPPEAFCVLPVLKENIETYRNSRNSRILNNFRGTSSPPEMGGPRL